ncbi:anthranilate phosphoribosyltransferase [Alterisphingorhabdus coralli]|uniref:Anthranilate phosphoribosyltransferase n=1 Tax=Alterisphingorhabdus coralli TaxID=3071408 RepID=A0AA97F456_9SPHN|nr:anthranilate phosphoribosyltransferase [Parasphingorhabdus sp. SCSIO 66989]WOE73946.1 anthranilate phosphoribosyltransferase [Parasphingorhabdus sp. SCSIO 66989]
MSNAVPPLDEPLALEDAEALFSAVLDGEYSAEEISDILVTLADRGEAATEIAGAARAMRQRMVPLPNAPKNAIDVCGTGGDGSHSLNVSTAVSLVVAACEVPVAKHGNRAASSKSGAADTLEALGIRLDRTPEENSALLNDLGIAFLFAPAHHPALGAIAPIRKALGRRTIFNLLGPLCNPALVRRQLIGVAHPDLVPVYAEAAQMLDYERLMIVSGMEGLDEISIAGPTLIHNWHNGQMTEHMFNPEEHDLTLSPLSAICGGDADYNAAALRGLMAGEKSAYRDAVLINSAAALQIAGEAESWAEGLEEAEEALDKGLANALLNCWIAI